MRDRQPRTSNFLTRNKASQITAVTAVTAPMPTASTSDRGAVSPMTGQVTTARTSSTRKTDSGLSSSSGASSANHDRVFGNRRLPGRADDGSRPLVTARAPAVPRAAQPRQVGTDSPRASILSTSAVPGSA